MKKQIKIIILVLVFILIVLVSLRLFFNGGEDTWIKDEKGVYVKHGNPSSMPDYVKEQQAVIEKAQELFQKKKNSGMNFSSQCLGSVGDYAVDIVNVPRINEDNLAENQCGGYIDWKVKHFIEIDIFGNVVRII
jgi:hypothetical protein